MIDELSHLHSPLMETWLVTGARGFLGTNAGVFLRDRAEIIGQARVAGPSPHYGDLVGIDLRDADAIGSFIRDLAPDVVLHGAAVSGHETCAKDPEQAHAVNVVATAAIARLQRKEAEFTALRQTIAGLRGELLNDHEAEGLK